MSCINGWVRIPLKKCCEGITDYCYLNPDWIFSIHSELSGHGLIYMPAYSCESQHLQHCTNYRIEKSLNRFTTIFLRNIFHFKAYKKQSTLMWHRNLWEKVWLGYRNINQHIGHEEVHLWVQISTQQAVI